MTYKYLASAYTDPDPAVIQRRFEEAEHCLDYLLSRKIWTFSPIVHCHALAKKYDLPKDHLFWQEYDRAMILASRGIIILKDGDNAWTKSKGVQDEMLFSRQLNLPIETVERTKDEYIIERLWP